MQSMASFHYRPQVGPVTETEILGSIDLALRVLYDDESCEASITASFTVSYAPKMNRRRMQCFE